MEYTSLFERLERQLLETLQNGSEDMVDVCTSIIENFKTSEIDTDRMIAELSAILNGACAVLLESMRDMGYNLQGVCQQGNRVRSFQYLNKTLQFFPKMSRYDLGAFFGCTLPTIIDLRVNCDPTFHEAVFENCNGLETLILPASFGRVPVRFLAGSTIKHVYAPSVAMVGAHAFHNCCNLVSVEFAELNGVEDYAFANCKELQVNGSFFEEMYYIGTKAFAGSGPLTVTLLCPQHIGDYAFSCMPNLTFMSVSTTVIPYHFAYDCRELIRVQIPFAKKISAGAFACNPNLKFLDMPSKVILYTRAFYNTGLESVNLTDAEFDGSSQFELCFNLHTIILGRGMVRIPDRFCYGCSSLKQLVTQAQGEPLNRVIHKNGQLGSLISSAGDPSVLDGNALLFMNDNEEKQTATCDDCVLAPKLLTIGENAFTWCEQLNNVNLWNTHRIQARAFYNSGVQQVVTRAKIGPASFCGCSKLEVACLPSQTKIAPRTFLNCSKLRLLNIYATDFGPYAFSGCSALHINFASKSPCFIGPYAFERTILDQVILGDGSRIASFAFKNTEQHSILGKVQVGAGSKIVQRAFFNSNVQRVHLGADVLVGAYSFHKCTRLHTVLADTNLIGQGAFSACKSLKRYITTRQFQLSTKHHFSWKGTPYPTSKFKREIFAKTQPQLSLLCPANILKVWSLGTSPEERESVRAFFFGLSHFATRFQWPFVLPTELYLEMAFSLFVLAKE